MEQLQIILGFVVAIAVIIVYSKLQLRKRILQDVYDACTKPIQMVFYGDHAILKNQTEMNLWINPVLIRTAYPKLSDKTIDKVIDRLTRDVLRYDYLYIQGDRTLVLRIPEICVLSFGTNCHDCRELPMVAREAMTITGSYMLVKSDLGFGAHHIKSISRQ